MDCRVTDFSTPDHDAFYVTIWVLNRGCVPAEFEGKCRSPVLFVVRILAGRSVWNSKLTYRERDVLSGWLVYHYEHWELPPYVRACMWQYVLRHGETEQNLWHRLPVHEMVNVLHLKCISGWFRPHFRSLYLYLRSPLIRNRSSQLNLKTTTWLKIVHECWGACLVDEMDASHCYRLCKQTAHA